MKTVKAQTKITLQLTCSQAKVNSVFLKHSSLSCASFDSVDLTVLFPVLI